MDDVNNNGLPPQKFIISDGELIIGRAELHKQLVYDESHMVAGGGWWHWDRENNVMLLYGKSEQYGQICMDDLLHCTHDISVPKGIKYFLFSKRTLLSQALIDYKIAQEMRETEYVSDRTCLPAQYIEVVTEPFYKGRGEHSIAQLEELCEQFKERCHQQSIVKQQLIDHIKNNY